ncbi:MAG: biopolymer transporter ExbD, partial [Betaproteobacteria bacterium]|nr:biopolymer transporter ExbD [Betaproteobacteria bacterium]
MNFRHSSGQRSEPEINLVPLIDVMLVIIIFLMMTMTFNKTAGLEISLPTADAK